MGTVHCPCGHSFFRCDIPSPYEYNLVPDTTIEALTKRLLTPCSVGRMSKRV